MTPITERVVIPGTSMVGGIACVYVCMFLGVCVCTRVHVMRNGILVYMYYIHGYVRF